MAIRNVYVDTVNGSASPSDPTNPGDAYNTLSNAEAGEQGDLVSSTTTLIINCSGSTIDSTKVLIDGSTTSDLYSITVVGDRTLTTYDTSAYRLEITGTPFGDFIIISDPFVHLDKLQVLYNTNRSSTYSAIAFTATPGWGYVSNSIVFGSNIGAGKIAGLEGVSSTSDGDRYFWNNIVITDGVCLLVSTQNSPDIFAYSNTFYSSGSDALDRQFNAEGTVTLKNNYAASLVGSAYPAGDTWNTKTTCASDDSTGSTGLQNIAYSTSTGAYFENVTAGSEDLSIKTDSALKDVGEDTSGESAPLDFTTDIVGTTRSSWDIGAFEFEVGGLTLLIDSLNQSQTIDNLNLIQQHVLPIDPSEQSQVIDNLDLVQNHVLAIDPLNQSQSTDNVNLIQANILTILNSDQTQSIDNIELVQDNVIAISDPGQSQSLDTVTLSTGTNLQVVGNTQPQESDNVDMIQANTVVIDPLNQLQAVDNITLSTGIILDISKVIQSQNIDIVNLIQQSVLAPDDSDQPQDLEQITLDSGIILAISDMIQNQSSGNLDLTQSNILGIDPLEQGQVIDNVVFAQIDGKIIITLTIKSPGTDLEIKSPDTTLRIE